MHTEKDHQPAVGSDAENAAAFDPNPKASCLMKMLDERIYSFQKRRQQNRRMAFRLQIGGTILSALTTILLGIQFKDQLVVAAYLRNAALGFSAMVTVIAAWAAFFDHKGLWVKYTKTRSQLIGIKAEIDYRLSAGGVIEDKIIDALFDQYQQVLSESNEAWLQVRGDGRPKV